MSKRFLVNINMGGNQIVSPVLNNAIVYGTVSDPGSGSAGQLFYNTSTNLIKYWNGSVWTTLSTGGTAVSTLNTFQGSVTIAGTSNQIAIINNANTITLSFPTNVTLPGKTTLSASTTGRSSLNIPAATSDPSAPVVGDVWTTASTGANILYYNGATKTVAFTDSNITGSAGSVANSLTIGNGLTVAGPYNGSAAVTVSLPSTITAGSVGSSSAIPVITYDTYGRITAVSTASISSSISLAGTSGTGSVSTGGTLTITGGTGISTAASGSTITVTNGGVLSVNGSTGTITGIATLASPTFTGTVTVPATGIVYPGSTSGQSILSAPATAGTNTAITLPATAGTLALNNQTFYLGSTPITINQSTGTITSITGLSITGNAGTATTLATARTINGTSFNGSANITIAAANPFALTIGTGLSGTSYDGSSAITIANTGVLSITGTANQVVASASTGAVTLSLPQSIATTSTPTFAQITISNNPVSATDAATKQYVDNIASGINAHDAVIAATTASLTVTYNNNTTGVGATLTNAGTQAAFSIDSVTLNSGDRVLVKNQASSLQNGLYTVTTVGNGSTNWVLTRATDYDQSTAGEVAAGDTVFVVAPAAQLTGTPVNQNTGWTMNSAGTITIGTSAITFAQNSGTGTVTATNGLTIVTGNQVGVNLGSAFDATTGTGTSGLSISGGTLQVRLSASGGLTSSTAGLALNTPGTGLTISGNAISFLTGTTTQSASGVSGGTYTYGTQKQVATIAGTNTLPPSSFIIAHNLNTRDVAVQVYDAATYDEVEVDVVRTSISSITITFAIAPVSGQNYSVVMIG